jgi:hypothetical protein
MIQDTCDELVVLIARATNGTNQPIHIHVQARWALIRNSELGTGTEFQITAPLQSQSMAWPRLIQQSEPKVD